MADLEVRELAVWERHKDSRATRTGERVEARVQRGAECCRPRERISFSTLREVDAAFATMVQVGAGALAIGNDAFFNSHIELSNSSR
jgi:hypothetical protein